MSNSLQSRGLQHARLPCPSPTSGACSNSCPLSRWCHPPMSSSAIPFSTCLQSFPASETLSMNRLFASGGQSVGASASASVLPMYIQEWFPLRLTGLISLPSKGLSSLLQYHSWKASVLQHSAFFMVQLSHQYMTTGKTTSLTIWTFVSKVMSLILNMLSRFVTAFFFFKEQASFNFMAAVTICSDFGDKENKVWHCFHFLLIYFPWSNQTGWLYFLNGS